MSSVPWPGPRRSVEDLAVRYGRETVAAACRDLLAGRDVSPELVFGLGGPPARWAIDGSAAGPDYWLRVWALRGLLWLWDPGAAQAVVESLADEAWRVREMAAKVAARHLLDEALPTLVLLRDDPVSRVGSAAQRAVVRLTAPGG